MGDFHVPLKRATVVIRFKSKNRPLVSKEVYLPSNLFSFTSYPVVVMSGLDVCLRKAVGDYMCVFYFSGIIDFLSI